MKRSRTLLSVLLLWLLPLSRVVAQADTAGLVLRHLPTQGLVLGKGWKFRAGDDPAWARPSYDDSRWDTLAPLRPARRLPRAPAGIGWFRLRFRVGKPLQHRPLLLQAGYTGAPEIYLNGRRLQCEGTLDARPAGVRPRHSSPEPVEVAFEGPAEQVLAVRLAPWHPPLLIQSLDGAPLLPVGLVDARSFRQQQHDGAVSNSLFLVLSGVFLLLTLLHWAFFRYNPAQRANLYFALYAGSVAFYSLGQYPYSFLRLDTALGVYACTNVLVYLSTMWAVRALYALFGVRPGRNYRRLWLILCVLLPLSVWQVPPGNIDYYYSAFFALATVQQLRLTGRALRLRQRGAVTIGIGFASGLLFLLLLLLLAGLNVALSDFVANLFIPLIYLPPGLGISLFLAREFALDSQLLQLKLHEVEHLSAQARAQEQEKQALLAQQNETLEQQVRQRTAELQRSLDRLQTTQTQLVQSEKMASLGELTAGIAHEIQNPLNFVNNFADVSVEMLGELREEQAKGAAANEALATELFDDIAQNLHKIHHHGQRAASIVKGMLQHSRASNGERAPTDLNRLAEEYLHLAYQGLRTKDKAFNAVLVMEFGTDLPPVETVAADVGRVLLNLFSNAFYAVRQRQQSGEAGYVPTVRVCTRRAGPQAIIRVSDNGRGMPAAVRAKVFQPFFTTKPEGEGTGLGLSLAYDTITKGHGGTLTVESEEGVGTEFVITLPIQCLPE